MKTLILSCNTGGGHNTAAKALKEVFDSQNDDCVIKDALSFGGQLASDLVCDSYIEMVKRAPKMFGELYKLGGKIGQINSVSNDILRSPVYLVNKLYADALEEYILQNEFDAIICTHIFPLEALTHLRRRHNLKTPIYFIVTDYAATPMLEETVPDIIFSPHKDSLYTFTAKGIPEDKIIATGIPVAQKFTVPRDKNEARKDLGLSAEQKVYLLMGGSMGFGDTEDTVSELLSMADENTRLIVITGSNKELYASLDQKFNGNRNLMLVGFTDKVNDYMAAADVLMTKPGGLSSTEALVRGIPLIHTSPIPGCETENAEFFTQHHISLCAKDSKEAARLAKKLVDDKFLSRQILDAQKNYRYENSAEEVVKIIKQRM